MTELTNERDVLELAHCPFCGGAAEVIPGKGQYAYIAACTLCRAENFGMTEAQACAAWNRRATVACDNPPPSDCALPPLPAPSARLYEQNGYRRASVLPGPGTPLYTAEQVEQIRRDAVEADRRARQPVLDEQANVMLIQRKKIQKLETELRDKLPASAAQGVKTWQERTGNHNIRPGSVKHMLAEIADLRAQLARQQSLTKAATQVAESAQRRADRAAQLARQSQEPQGQAELDAAFAAAVERECPIPDTPHASVMTRAIDERAAMWRGINAARKIIAAAPAHPVAQPAPTPQGEQ